MKKLANKKPLLFGIILMIAEPLFILIGFTVLALFIMLFTGADVSSSSNWMNVFSIIAIIPLALLVKRWMPEGYYYGMGKKALGLCCLMLLPLLLEALLYIIDGNLSLFIGAELSPLDAFTVFISGLTPGITEEVVYRGWLLSCLVYAWKEKKWGIQRAVIVSALLFSLTHLVNMLSGQDIMSTLGQLAFTLAMGSIFAAAYIRSHNLLGPILFHAGHDIFGLLLLSLGANAEGAASGVSWIQLALYIIIIVYSFWLIRPSKTPEIHELWTLSPKLPE